MSPANAVRRLRFFATMWSLRGYPSVRREWSWPRKRAEILAAGFDGIMSPPRPELQDRGDLGYLAISRVDRAEQVEPLFASLRGLRPVGLILQIGRFDTPLRSCLRLVREITEAGGEAGVPVEFETHRNTFLETPEKAAALDAAWRSSAGGPLPLCYDFAHFAVVRHLRAPFWPEFAGQREAILRARCLHLRPFTGHHCQIPVTSSGRRRTPEYRTWLEFVRELFANLRTGGAEDRIIVPELGHEAPSYRLSGFPDTWTDTCLAHADLRRLWRESAASP